MSCTPYPDSDSSSGPKALHPKVRDLRSPKARLGRAMELMSYLCQDIAKKASRVYKLLCQGIHNRLAQNIWTRAQFMGLERRGISTIEI